ncbi:uncharacterized protein METZ01_LOCUS292713, partial [marine metagenome]
RRVERLWLACLADCGVCPQSWFSVVCVHLAEVDVSPYSLRPVDDVWLESFIAIMHFKSFDHQYVEGDL